MRLEILSVITYGISTPPFFKICSNLELSRCHRQREDTIRCIVTSFTATSEGDDIFEEFSRGDGGESKAHLPLDQGDDEMADDDIDTDANEEGGGVCACMHECISYHGCVCLCVVN